VCKHFVKSFFRARWSGLSRPCSGFRGERSPRHNPRDIPTCVWIRRGSSVDKGEPEKAAVRDGRAGGARRTVQRRSRWRARQRKRAAVHGNGNGWTRMGTAADASPSRR